jgi:hypothetical protein
MKKDVEEYIKKYVSCQKNKITQISTKLPLQLTTTPHSVMQKMHSEVVGTITISSKQNRRVHLNNGGRADMVSGCSACERENRWDGYMTLCWKCFSKLRLSTDLLPDCGADQ